MNYPRLTILGVLQEIGEVIDDDGLGVASARDIESATIAT
ncbi:hypothetical protein SCE1572_35665 [Sorangium cellulosum So0157-2]|uniref:Uncharacterized protein n=1 Tax=Sorangium cellulosum So0157-2 TaxID=1254432 RepID=S4Y946_SORCE|nr:hypothetical protein SCE1572_35665 [Sorangium cellulosum So0157-2]